LRKETSTENHDAGPDGVAGGDPRAALLERCAAEREARIAAERRAADAEQRAAAAEERIASLDRRLQAAELRTDADSQEHDVSVRAEAIREYVMAGAHCLLWYADIRETNDPRYLHWQMEFPNAQSARRFLPIEVLPGESMTDAWYNRRHPEDRDACDRIGTAAVRAGEDYQQEFRCACEDGTVRWLHEDVRVETITPGDHWRAVGVCTDITALRQQHAHLQAANRRLNSSIVETHHRVKNNLQIIAALVDMQDGSRNHSEETRAALRHMGQHIRAVAAMHDLLTREAHSGAGSNSIAVRPVLEKLADLVRGTTSGRTITLELSDVRLPARMATALVLLANELIANAVNHGRGEITIALAPTGAGIRLDICDDGPGFPAGFDPLASGTHGLEIAESIAELDLRTALRYETRSEGGARVSLEFLPAAR